VASCSEISRNLDEDLAGTATEARYWVLLEQPGPWGARAVFESGLDAALAARLARWADDAGARLTLIRGVGPERADEADGPRHVYLIDTATARADHRMVSDPSEILEWTRKQAGGMGGGADEAGPASGITRDGAGRGEAGPPFWVICTNGRRDPCCGTFGRPLARAVVAAAHGRVWESSHVGGHRFAANMVCFPHGLVFGRLDPESGAEAARRYEEGRILLDHYRGRSCLPPEIQAAEVFVRRALGVIGINEVDVVRHSSSGDSSATTFAVDGQSVRVTVRSSAASPARPVSCQAADENPPSFRLVAIDD